MDYYNNGGEKYQQKSWKQKYTKKNRADKAGQKICFDKYKSGLGLDYDKLFVI